MKIALVGDSVFDNKVYVGVERSTQEWLQELLPEDDILLFAIDGSVTKDVIDSQIGKIAEQNVDAFFVSTGGNDALSYSNIIYEGFDDQTVRTLRYAQVAFKQEYEELVQKLKATDRPLAVFTAYNGNFLPDEDVQNAASVAIAIFNDVIYRVSCRHNVPVFENRSIFTRTADYANPIEPSTIGSEKMATAMSDWVRRLPKRTRE